MSIKSWTYLAVAALVAAVGVWWWRTRSATGIPAAGQGGTTAFGTGLQNYSIPPVSSGSGPGITAKNVVQAGAGVGAAAACASAGAGVASPACAMLGSWAGGKAYNAGANVASTIAGWF